LLLNFFKGHLMFWILPVCLIPSGWHSSWSLFLFCDINFAPGTSEGWGVSPSMQSLPHSVTTQGLRTLTWQMPQVKTRERSLLDGFMGLSLDGNGTG
jgi:hypothetical protein